MNRHRTIVVSLFALALSACEGREELTLNARGSFVVERPFATAATMDLEGRWHDAHTTRAQFQPAWDAVTKGSSSAGAVAFTLSGGTPADAQGVTVLTALVLVLPTPLQVGRRYTLGAAIAPPSETEMPMYWNVWGPHSTTRSDQADVALRVFDYHTIGMRVENDFIARVATGTVDVLRRIDNSLELRVDITATDATGRVLRVRGDVDVRAERYTPPAT